MTRKALGSFILYTVTKCLHPLTNLRALLHYPEHLFNSPFAHCIHVHAHSRDLATAVLVKFVATCLTSEAIKKKLVAKITVGQLEEGFPYLQR